MIQRVSMVVAIFAIAVIAGASAATADTLPDIDWRDFVEGVDDGDHVVGEEMCAGPQRAKPRSASRRA